MNLRKKDFKEKHVDLTLRDLELIIQSLFFYRSICYQYSLIPNEIDDKSFAYYILNRDITELCDKLQNF